MPVADHASDARSVFSHVLDFLKKDSKMSEEAIGKSVTSSSSDCEAVYTGDIQGCNACGKKSLIVLICISLIETQAGVAGEQDSKATRFQMAR